jgi:hypothetical protein
MFVICMLATVFTPVAAEDQYTEYPVVKRVESINFYSDSHGSMVDQGKLKERETLIKSLRKFVTDACRHVDSNDRAEQEYALGMLRKWASGGAILDKPAISTANGSVSVSPYR